MRQNQLSGAVEVRVHPEVREAEPGETIKLTAVVVNAKAGHMIPTGSAEERVVWLHVEATDAAGIINAVDISPQTFIAAPGVPLGLSRDAQYKCSDRLIHDPLQIGVATMVLNACQSVTRSP